MANAIPWAGGPRLYKKSSQTSQEEQVSKQHNSIVSASVLDLDTPHNRMQSCKQSKLFPPLICFIFQWSKSTQYSHHQRQANQSHNKDTCCHGYYKKYKRVVMSCMWRKRKFLLYKIYRNMN